MKRLPVIFLLLSLSLLSACEKTGGDASEDVVKPPKGFVELVQAYQDGKVFLSAEHTDAACILTFEDGYSLTIEETSFRIYDCTENSPAKVMAESGWWTVDGVVKAIKVDAGATDLESLPVYVYHDVKTLHAHLSNGNVLRFGDVQDELERLQNIPTVHIEIGGRPILDKKNYVDGTITFKDPGKLYSDVEEVTLDMGIRGRGNSTWSFPKKPWKVKLDENASIFGMPADKEWCLLANYADRTLLRNIVAMKLSEICEFSWTPRMVSVEVYLDGEYQGVYNFCEHKKISADRVNIDVDGGDVYMEIEQQQDETTCWWTGMGVPMMFSDPEVPSDDQLSYIKKYFADFEAALYSDDFDDPDVGYAAYIDVDSFIDYYIVQELSKNTDGNLRKSSFITKEVGMKMEMYHLWDFDLTFGNSGWVMHDPEGFWVKDYNSSCVIGDNWYNRMFRDPAFVDRLQTRWNELMPQLQSIPDFIDEQALHLDKAKDRNFQVWDIWESVDWVDCPSLGSYEKEIEFFKEFYTTRLQWLDHELNIL